MVAAIGVSQYLPSSIEGQDCAVITADIRVVLLYQGPVGSLDVSAAGSGCNTQHAIGIGSGFSSSQGSASAGKGIC